MNLDEYTQMQFSKAFNRADINDTPAVADESSPSREVYHADPKKWTAKIIDDEKLLFFNDRFLNISKLKDEIEKLYTSQGYEHYGFAKLSETELVRYKTLRDIICGEFLRDYGGEELDPAAVAQIIFDNEAKEFEWRPEQLTV